MLELRARLEADPDRSCEPLWTEMVADDSTLWRFTEAFVRTHANDRAGRLDAAEARVPHGLACGRTP